MPIPTTSSPVGPRARAVPSGPTTRCSSRSCATSSAWRDPIRRELERDPNDYVFERAVRPATAGRTAPRRIDLYGKDAFILEAKQSRLPGKDKAIPGQLPLPANERSNSAGAASPAAGT